LAILKNSVFLSWLFWIFFLLHPHENQSKLLGYQGWAEILMITLVYSKRVSVRNNLLHTVCPKSFQNINSKVEMILKGSLDSIPSPSVKIQIMAGKFA
jgi:hypothetical protein